MQAADTSKNKYYIIIIPILLFCSLPIFWSHSIIRNSRNVEKIIEYRKSGYGEWNTKVLLSNSSSAVIDFNLPLTPRLIKSVVLHQDGKKPIAFKSVCHLLHEMKKVNPKKYFVISQQEEENIRKLLENLVDCN